MFAERNCDPDDPFSDESELKWKKCDGEIDIFDFEIFSMMNL